MLDKVRKLLVVLLSLVAAGAAGYLIWYYGIAAKTEQSYEEARQKAVAERPVKRPAKEENSVPKPDIPVDFDALQAVNPDVYGWIRIEGTKVDYPVVQSLTEDHYYLDHTWEGKKAPEGAIFTQACNARDFTDFNTAVYGHQMGEGMDTMFHTLAFYLNEGFMEQHPEVIVYTREHVLKYRVFAAVIYDDRHLIGAYNYVMNEERQAFLDSIRNSRDLRNRYSDAENVGIDDRILSLSTCVAGEPGRRLLVEAVLTDEE